MWNRRPIITTPCAGTRHAECRSGSCACTCHQPPTPDYDANLAANWRD